MVNKLTKYYRNINNTNFTKTQQLHSNYNDNNKMSILHHTEIGYQHFILTKQQSKSKIIKKKYRLEYYNINIFRRVKKTKHL